MYSLNYIEAFERLLNYYYSEAPGRIMPLFLLYLAREDKRNVFVEEKLRDVLDWKDNPEKKYISPILSQFTKIDAEKLALTDPAGRHIIDRWKCNEMDHMSIVVLNCNETAMKIRSFFQKRDEELDNGLDDTAIMRIRKALFTFVQCLERIPQEVLNDNYLLFADMILKAADVIDDIEDLDFSNFERWIIGKEFDGRIFVPKSKAPFVVAGYHDAIIKTGSFGDNAELNSMISYLIVKGSGSESIECTTTESPFCINDDDKYDLVIMNSIHFDKYKNSDWHNCLKSIQNNLSETGRFYGLVEKKNLFTMLEKQKLFQQTIKNKTLDSIILLPREYGCALVSISKAKKTPDEVSVVNLYNESIKPHNRNRTCFEALMNKCKRIVQIEDLQRANFKIASLFEYELPEIDGFELQPLRKYLRRITPSSSFCVSNYSQEDSIQIITIDPKDPYNPYRPTLEASFVDTFSIYHNYYYLDGNSLIVSCQGNLNARLFDGTAWPAYIKDVLAFSIQNGIVDKYIINELRKPYVQMQVEHWKGSPKQHHCEDEILDLKIYIPKENILNTEQEIVDKELNERILPNGFILRNKEKKDEYEIIKCLGNGAFGITYLAQKRNYRKNEKSYVALKEYMVQEAAMRRQGSKRDSNHRVSMTLGSIKDIKSEWNPFVYLIKFVEEAELMAYFKQFTDCRIVPSTEIFKDDRTNTYYNVMECYVNGTLTKELEKNGLMEESKAIERIILPLARAVKTMHDNRWLHLDIKADNVLLDNEGYAMLGDLGISQQWDEEGNKLTKGVPGIGSEGASEKQKSFDKKFASEFHPEQDVYSLAALFYYIVTGEDDHRNFFPEDLAFCDELSEESKQAIIAALSNGDTLESTPKNVLDFVRMLPGCKDVELPELLPETQSADDCDWSDQDYDSIRPKSLFNHDFLPKCPPMTY